MKIDTIIYALIAILLIVGAAMFFTSSYSKNHYTYTNNGEKFEVRKISDSETQVKAFVGEAETPYILTFRYDPLSLEDIPIDGSIKLRLSDDNIIYIAMSPNHTVDFTIAALEIGKYLALPDFYGKQVVAALTEPSQANTTDPIKTCKEATIYTTIILLKVEYENRAYLDQDNNNCIVVEGRTGEELMKVADRVAYQILGIMP